MERSVIREKTFQPGLRFAPSGLRALKDAVARIIRQILIFAFVIDESKTKMHNADYHARARGASSGRRSKMERVRCPRARGNLDLREAWSSSGPGGFRGLPLWTCWTWTGPEMGMATAGSACATGPGRTVPDLRHRGGAPIGDPHSARRMRAAWTGPRCKPRFWSRGSQNDAPLGALPPSQGRRKR